MKKLFFLFIFPFVILFTAEGIDYSYFECPHAPELSWVKGMQAIHVLQVDPEKHDIRSVRALDSGLGRETVLSLAKRYGALASVNGGFFAIGGTFDGNARGALKIHDWVALPFKPRGCVGWSRGCHSLAFDRLLVDVKVNYERASIPISGLNRPRKNGEIIAYTPNFHRTTLTEPDGEEIVVVDGIIQSIVRGGSSTIPESGYVLSVHKAHPLFGSFQIGKILTLSTKVHPLEGLTTAEEWENAEYIVGGTPLLFYNKGDAPDYRLEKTIKTFLTKRHARTAVGFLPTGIILFVVVDQTDRFEGMTINELKNLMKGLGCIAALNLDGGGSSTMVLHGAIVNSPRGDKDESEGKRLARPVSDAIIICPKPSPST